MLTAALSFVAALVPVQDVQPQELDIPRALPLRVLLDEAEAVVVGLPQKLEQLKKEEGKRKAGLWRFQLRVMRPVPLAEVSRPC